MECVICLTLIVLLRHGQAQNNVERVLAGRTPGFELTENGIKQAQSAAILLESLRISHIYSSPITRARQTAEIVSDVLSSDITLDDRLLELDMGKFTGMKYADIEPAYGNVFEKFYYGHPEVTESGIETFADVKSRMSDIMDYVVARHANENVLLVTHMDPIKAMLSNVANMHPQSLYRLLIANASLTILGYSDGALSLMGVNVMETDRFNHNW